MVWTELNATAGGAQLESLLSSFLETAIPFALGFSMLPENRKPYSLSCCLFSFGRDPRVPCCTEVLLCSRESAKRGDAEWYCRGAQGQSFLSHTRQTLIALILHLYPAEAAVTCPDRDPELEIWNPGHNKENRVEIHSGRKLLLSSSATVHSIHITDGGKTCCWQGWVTSALHWECLNYCGSCWESFLLLAGKWVATGQTQLYLSTGLGGSWGAEILWPL